MQMIFAITTIIIKYKYLDILIIEILFCYNFFEVVYFGFPGCTVMLFSHTVGSVVGGGLNSKGKTAV